MSMADSYRYNCQEGFGKGCGSTLLSLFVTLCNLAVFFITIIFLSSENFLPAILLVVGALLINYALPKQQEKCLEIYNRYFIFDSRIVYFGNITDFTVNQVSGLLEITYTADDMTQHMTIRRDLFPTNARKPHKIQANKQQKFNKVSHRIQREIQRHAPQVLDRGVR